MSKTPAPVKSTRAPAKAAPAPAPTARVPVRAPQKASATAPSAPAAKAAPARPSSKTSAAPKSVIVAADAAVEGPAIITIPKSGKIVTPFDDRYRAMQAEIDAIEKSVGIETTSLIQSGYVQNAIHTGVLMYDLTVGGGAAPGRMTILPGLEGSGKSTIVDNLAAVCALQQIPIFWFDAEGALDPNYVGRIFGRYGLRIPDLMGIRNPKTGKWDVPPLLRYSQDSIGEHVFKTIAHICHMLPFVKQNPADRVWYRTHTVKGKPTTWVPDERQGKPQYLFIVDSWPALLPEAINDNPDSSPMAANARMISAGMPLIKSPIAQKNCALFSVNQIRTRPGVTMGCLHADTVLPFVDGRSFTMQEVVDQQIEGEVWSLNEETGAIEPRKITGWHDNGLVEDADDWINFRTTAVDTPHGFNAFTVTPDHEVKVGSGKTWKKAKALKVGDKLVTKRREILNGTLRDFMVGKFIGDCSLYADKRAGTAAFKLRNEEQPEYLAWTISKLSKYIAFNRYSAEADVHGSEPSAELRTWFDRMSGAGKTGCTRSRSVAAVASDVTDLGLALWYMDDGCLAERPSGGFRATFSHKRFRDNAVEAAAVSALLRRFKIEHTVHPAGTSTSLTEAGTRTLCSIIAKFVPVCMQHKLVPEYRGRYEEFELEATPQTTTQIAVVTQVRRGSKRIFRAKRKFDITVEGNHNYMVGSPTTGVIVHNSPQYEPCGLALGFFSDIRTQIMKVAPSTIGAGKGQYTEEPSINGGVDKYVYAKLKNTKNKAFTPFREGSIRIRFERESAPGDGICRTWDIMQYLLATGQAIPRVNQRLEMHLRPVSEKARAHNMFEEGKTLGRAEFKTIVEAPQYKQALYQHCLQQIRSGYAFDIERESVFKAIEDAKSSMKTSAALEGDLDFGAGGDEE